MDDLLRKGFLLGLGAAIAGKEKLDNKLKELVDKNELTIDEAKEVMRNFVEKGELKKSQWDIRQDEKTQEKYRDLGLATKEDIKEVHARIDELIKKLDTDDWTK